MGWVMVVYYSASGNTRRMAELVGEGVRMAGHEAKVAPVDEMEMKDFFSADGYALGSPDYFTYVAGRMKTLFDELLPERDRIKGKPFVGFVSHGGGGGALESLEKLAKAVGLTRVAEGVKCKGVPADMESAELCRQLGVSLARAVS